MSETLPLVPAGFLLLSTFGFFLQIIFGDRRIGRWSMRLFFVGLSFQTVLLVLALIANGFPFLSAREDFYALASWVVGAAFLGLSRRYPLPGGGAFFVPATLALYLLALVAPRGAPGGLVGSTWGLFHVLFMSLAFSIFALSFLVGLAFLIQEHRIKNHRAGPVLSWFPPLEVMANINQKALGVGFALLSLGILAGAFLSKGTRGRFFTGDPQQLAALAVWLLYAVFLNIRIQPRWRGRRGVVLSVLGFSCVILAFVGLTHRGF